MSSMFFYVTFTFWQNSKFFNDSAFFSFDDGVIVGMLKSGHLFLWSPSRPQSLGLVYGLTQFLSDFETSLKTSKSRVVAPWNNVCNSGSDYEHSLETYS